MNFLLKRKEKSDDSAASGQNAAHPVPEFAKPTEAERTALRRAGNYQRLRGTAKRVQMLKDLYDDHTQWLREAHANGIGQREIADREAQRREVGEESRRAARKSVGSIPAEEIWKRFQVGEPVVQKSPSGVLWVSLPVWLTESIVGGFPKGLPVVDGTLCAEVRFGDVYVGGVVFPLPPEGIPADRSGELVLVGLCGRSVDAEGTYCVRLSPVQNLWVMEK